MGLRDRKADKNANFVKECITLPAIIASATGQTGLKIRGVTPGYAFQIVKVEVFAKTVTATLSVDVQIGSTSVLSSVITPVADTPTAGTLSSTLSAVRGSATDVINFLYTSNGTGAFTGMTAHVWIRPQPLDGETYSV